MNSLVEENYLKALYTLANANGEVNVNDLSIHLSIKKPTVTSMMKKLAAKSLVHYESYKPLRLTEDGKREAALILRKHRLTEMFLVEKMGFGWEEVHEIAEQVEHVKAPKFFEKMDELLNYPSFDPHGSPIPNSNGEIKEEKYLHLSDCATGDTVKVKAVAHSSNEFLTFLNRREIKLGLEIYIESIESFDASMRVKVNDEIQSLSHTVCERLLVEKVS
ncbi:metal-dependent transcriptional regulator [Crocinitomix algicola]|uniref:metal-dependent transcriptional regulator n=1 Tax=Crocinitomix algicola TaxID=1740263 RepID=UPI0008727591|nr:metal-dependent transcriptional regulator [Crocinitomix algicola]